MTQRGSSGSAAMTRHSQAPAVLERGRRSSVGAKRAARGAGAKPVHGAALATSDRSNLQRLPLSTGPATASVTTSKRSLATATASTSFVYPPLVTDNPRRSIWRPGCLPKQRQGVLSRMRARDPLDSDPGIGPTPVRHPRRVSTPLSSMRVICLTGWRYNGSEPSRRRRAPRQRPRDAILRCCSRRASSRQRGSRSRTVRGGAPSCTFL